MLAAGESVLWSARPVYPIRYPLLTIVSFFGWFLVTMGSVWIPIGVVSFLLFPIFAGITLWKAVRHDKAQYHITTQRIVYDGNQLLLEHLGSAQATQPAGFLRRSGTVTFQTIDGSSFSFKRVRQPGMVRDVALNAKTNLPSLTRVVAQEKSGPVDELIVREVLVKCPYCGATSRQGTTTCPACGGSL